MAQQKEIRVPDLGDFSDVDVIEILVSPGDEVEVDDGLIVLETDKASMDVPSTAAGIVREIRVSAGDTVNEGDLIAVLETGEDGDDAADDQESQDSEAGREDSGEAGESTDSSAAADERRSDADEQGTGARASQARTVTVPDLGDFDEVDVIEVHVSEGDEVREEDPLLTLETDKASMDVPAPAAGRITELRISVGDKVNSGDEILTLVGGETEEKGGVPEDGDEDGKAGGAAAAATEREREAAPVKAAGKKREEEREAEGRQPRRDDGGHSTTPGLTAIDEAGFSRAHASPSVRKLARELGVDLVRVDGSGRKGRILADDVKAWVKKALQGGGERTGGAALPSVPEVDFSKYGDTATEPLGRIRKISARRLQASWLNLPHVTQHDLADITELEEKRQELKGPAAERGIKLTPLAFIIKACVQALKEFPRFNSSLHPDGEHLVMKHYMHVGFAADTPNGLVVPVIRDADRKDIYELAKELASLSAAAREGKLSAEQMQGGTFTVSSLGGIGGTAFTPIINAPEVAILGVSRSSMQPVWNGREFKPRLMLPLSLSYDHRIIDGADAARFTTWLSGALGDVSALVEAIP